MLDKRKRVMLASPSLSDGGAERVMLNVAAGLTQLGYDVDLVIKNDLPNNRYEVPESLAVHNLDAGKLFETTRKLAKRIKETKPDIVITALETLGFAAILAKCLSRHRPIVVPSVHTLLETSYREIPSNHNKRYRSMVKRLYPFANHIIAVSKGVKNEILTLTKVKDSKVSVLYNPVITDDTLRSLDQPVEHPWFGSDKVVAVAVGRLARAKNYPLMLQAVAEARKQINLHLIILGDGGLKDLLKEEAKALGIADYVDFRGFVPNPLSYVSKAEMFLLSSSWEGLGNVLIEALTTGTPIISTDCESGPREVLEGGKWGTLVRPDDVDSLANAIVKVANYRGIVPSIQSWDRFSAAKATSEYARLIESL